MASHHAHVSVTETLVIDEVSTWVSDVVTESLTSWVRHANAISAAAGASPARSRAAGRAAASEALRTAVADLTASLGSWMDGLAERKNAISVRRSDAIGIERALRMYGTLSVRVRHASNLVGAEPSAEPAVQLLVRGVELLTHGAADSARPTWDQQVHFRVRVRVRVRDPHTHGAADSARPTWDQQVWGLGLGLGLRGRRGTSR
jgi:hypothetical protein